jgi:hypothetical protein
MQLLAPGVYSSANVEYEIFRHNDMLMFFYSRKTWTSVICMNDEVYFCIIFTIPYLSSFYHGEQHLMVRYGKQN